MTDELPMRERIARAIIQRTECGPVNPYYLSDAILDEIRVPDKAMLLAAVRSAAAAQNYPIETASLRDIKSVMETAARVFSSMIDAAKEGK